MKNNLLLLLFVSYVFSSCSTLQITRFEKRHYLKGYNIETALTRENKWQIVSQHNAVSIGENAPMTTHDKETTYETVKNIEIIPQKKQLSDEEKEVTVSKGKEALCGKKTEQKQNLQAKIKKDIKSVAVGMKENKIIPFYFSEKSNITSFKQNTIKDDPKNLGLLWTLLGLSVVLIGIIDLVFFKLVMIFWVALILGAVMFLAGLIVMGLK